MFIIHATRLDLAPFNPIGKYREKKEICVIANDMDEVIRVREFLVTAGYNVEYNG